MHKQIQGSGQRSRFFYTQIRLIFTIFITVSILLTGCTAADAPDTYSSPTDNRIEITINGTSDDVALNKIVGQFNTNNSIYRVVIKEYEQERLLADLAAGTGPDLISSGMYVNFQDCVEKGLLEDLNTYLNNSTTLDREDLLPQVLSAYTINNVLTCIPPFFSIYNVYGKRSELGDTPGWTMTEFMDYINTNPHWLSSLRRNTQM